MIPLLRGILTSNPNAFNGPQRNSAASANNQNIVQVESKSKLAAVKESETNAGLGISASEIVKSEVPTSSASFHTSHPETSPAKIKKKKRKEIDQLQQDNRNLSKYDSRYPDTFERLCSANANYVDTGLTGDEFIDSEVKKFSEVYSKKGKKPKSEEDMAQKSLNVMAEQGLPALLNEESSSIDNTDEFSSKREKAAISKKHKREREDNERLTVRLQLSQVGGNDEMTDNVVYRNFVQLMEDIFRHVEDADMSEYTRNQDEDVEVPAEILVSRGLLSELVAETSKLCELGVTSRVGTDSLARLLTILQWNVRYGGNSLLTKPNADDDNNAAMEYEMEKYREVSAGRVIHSLDACLTILYTLTAPSLPRQLYTDEVIEAVVGAIRYQLHNTIFPEFDPLYRTDAEGKSYGNLKSKRSRSGHVKDKLVVQIYQKVILAVDLLANLVTQQDLGDTMLIKLTSIAVSPFFVENISELQLAALRLVVSMFAKHELIRQFILDDVLSSLTKLPSTKRNLRSYRLWNHNASIQMVTALVLNIVQCMAKLPDTTEGRRILESAIVVENSQNAEGQEQAPPVDPQSAVLQTSFDLARKTALLFITAFFKKCTQKSDDDYRPLFENFVQDLLTTAQRPEWPATDLMLTLLGSVLVKTKSFILSLLALIHFFLICIDATIFESKY